MSTTKYDPTSTLNTTNEWVPLSLAGMEGQAKLTLTSAKSGTLSDQKCDVAATRWENARFEARSRWKEGIKRYYATQGMEFFDYDSWLIERETAIYENKKASDERRRAEGDEELVEFLISAARRGRIQAPEIVLTKTKACFIKTIVEIVSNTGRLYCGYQALASKAWVSSRAALNYLQELEALGVLQRVRTGGIDAAGKKQTNKYTVKYNRLRAILGIENKWESKYGEEPGKIPDRSTLVAVINAYYNYEGFAHYSKSARQARRLAKRMRDAANAAGVLLKQTGNVLSDKEKCALTALYNKKDHINLQVTSKLIEKPTNMSNDSTQQSCSLNHQTPQAPFDILADHPHMQSFNHQLIDELRTLPIPTQKCICLSIQLNNKDMLPRSMEEIGNVQLKSLIDMEKTQLNL